MSINNIFASRIKFLVGDSSPTSFGRRCGIDGKTVKSALEGKIPGQMILIKIANVTGKSIEWMLGTEGNYPDKTTAEQPFNTAEIEANLLSDREFKNLCAASFDPVFEYIAEAYGKDSIGIANFLDDLRDVHHNYRVWRHEKKHERKVGEIMDDKEKLTAPKR